MSKSLAGQDLTKAKLFGATMSRADLSKAKLSKATLSGADLSGVTWSQETRWPEGEESWVRENSILIDAGLNIYRVSIPVKVPAP